MTYVLDATSLSFSLSLFLPHVNSNFSNMYTIPLSLVFSLFSPCSHAHLLYFLSRSLSVFSHAHLFYYLLLWTPPPSLSLTPPFSLQPHTHTHTLYSLLLQIRPLSVSSATLTVTLQTRTLPPYLSLALPPSLPLSLISHRMVPVSAI